MSQKTYPHGSDHDLITEEMDRLDLWTQIVPPTNAKVTFPARNTRLNGHSISDLKVGDSRADLDDLTSGFMSQDEIMRHAAITDTT